MLVQNNARKWMKVQKLTLKYQHYVLASFVLNLALFLQNSHHKSPVRLYLLNYNYGTRQSGLNTKIEPHNEGSKKLNVDGGT